MKLVMTLLVRDEEDVLEPNLEFHLAQGVDAFVVTDNGSIDATPEILRAYAERGVVEVIDEPATDFRQSDWVTRMARVAHERHGADWVLHNDADEFWLPGGPDLPAVFEAMPAEVESVYAPRANMAPVKPGRAPFHERMIYRETAGSNAHGNPLPPKVAHRGRDGVRVGPGCHTVEGLAGATRPIDVEIVHFPARSYAQFAKGVAHHGVGYLQNGLPPQIGHVKRALYDKLQRGRLERWYRKRELGWLGIRRGLLRGTLARDTRVRDALRRCPAGARSQAPR